MEKSGCGEALHGSDYGDVVRAWLGGEKLPTLNCEGWGTLWRGLEI